MFDYNSARENMVESQIRTSDVTDSGVLKAFRTIPRETFVPNSHSALSYADTEINLGDDRYLLRPRDFAKMVQAAEIRSTDVVLDIACGRGYSTAILAKLADTVIGLESDADIVERASKLLVDNDITNAAVIEGDFKSGAKEHGPFDVIFVNGAVEFIPNAWTSQLSDKGRIIAIIKDDQVGRAHYVTSSSGAQSHRVLFDAQAHILDGFHRPVEFSL